MCVYAIGTHHSGRDKPHPLSIFYSFSSSPIVVYIMQFCLQFCLFVSDTFTADNDDDDD